MRSTNILCRYLTVGFGCAVAIASATCGGQSFDSRYGLPPSGGVATDVASGDAPTPGEPLLSYRRDDASDAGTAAVKEPRLASSATLDGSNPLRKAPEAPAHPETTSPATTLPASLMTPPVQTILPEPMAAPTPIADAATPPLTSPATPAVGNLFPPMAAPAATTETPTTAPAAELLIRYDMAVQPAVHETEVPPADEPGPGFAATASEASSDTSLTSRRLAPPSSDPAAASGSEPSTDKQGPLPFAFSKLESFTTAGAGLAIVIGLFLICVWSLRRGGGGGKAGGVLPADAFAVLGRAPLTQHSFAHLLRLGNKLVLVAMSPDGIQPLTEVTDPMEVDRLTGLCASGRGYGPAAEFKQVLAQLAKEPARGFLGAEASEGGRRR